MNYIYLIKLYLPVSLLILGLFFLFFIDSKYRKVKLIKGHPAFFLTVMAFLISEVGKLQDVISKNTFNNTSYIDLLFILTCIYYLFISYRNLYINRQ